jgi:electron transport complex protein RnfB
MVYPEVRDFIAAHDHALPGQRHRHKPAPSGAAVRRPWRPRARRAAAADAVHALRLPDCRRYAQAIAEGERTHQPLPAGGREGIAALAALTGQPVAAGPACGVKAARAGRHRRSLVHRLHAVHQGLPGRCIVGAAKPCTPSSRTLCTGCELCVPAARWTASPAPVTPASAPAGRPGCPLAAADAAATSYAFTAWRARPSARTTNAWPPRPQAKLADLGRTAGPHTDPEARSKRAVIEAASPRRAPAPAATGSGHERATTSRPSSPRWRRPTRTRRRSWSSPSVFECWPPCCCRRRPPTSASTRPRADCSPWRRRRRRLLALGEDA